MPATIIGESHSIKATLGFAGKNLSLCFIKSMRSSKSSIRIFPASSTSRITLISLISLKISAKVLGSNEMILVSLLTKLLNASSTSFKETAHTSHWAWVIITSGFKDCINALSIS